MNPPPRWFKPAATLLFLVGLGLLLLVLRDGLEVYGTQQNSLLLARILSGALVEAALLAAVFRPAAAWRLLRRREVVLLATTIGLTVGGLWLLDALLGARQRGLADRVLAKEYRRRDTVRHHALINGATSGMATPEGLIQYRVNEFGQRGPSTPLVKPPGTARVLILGDSFLEGWQVAQDEMAASLLRESLAGRQIEVINGAVASYSPLLEYLYLRHEGFAFDPDLVLLFWDLADLQDDWGRSLLAVRDSTGDPVAVAPDPLEPEPPPAPWSARVRAFWLGGPITSLVRGWLAPAPPTVRFFGDDLLREGFHGDLERFRWPGPLRMINTFDGIGNQLEPAWAVTAELMARLSGWCRAREIALVVVLYPYGHLVSEREWTQGRVHFGIAPNTRASDAPLRRMESICKGLELPVIDLLPAFRAGAESAVPNTYYFADDPHWTPAGNRLAAEEVERQLVERQLLPTPRTPKFWREKDRR